MENLIKKYILIFSRLFHKELTPETIESIIQFIKFGLIGVTNTVISYVLNVGVLLLLQPLEVSWDYVAGNVIAFMISVLWSFYWNNRFVFVVREGEHRSAGKAILKTYISYGFTGIIINNLLSWMWIFFFNISKYIAPLINLIISVPLNFVINKLWAFKTDNNEGSKQE